MFTKISNEHNYQIKILSYTITSLIEHLKYIFVKRSQFCINCFSIFQAIVIKMTEKTILQDIRQLYNVSPNTSEEFTLGNSRNYKTIPLIQHIETLTMVWDSEDKYLRPRHQNNKKRKKNTHVKRLFRKTWCTKCFRRHSAGYLFLIIRPCNTSGCCE